MEKNIRSFLAQTSDSPYGIELDRAEGSFIWDTDGKRYIDLIAGIGVANIGHRHPRVLDAIRNQSERYLHTMVYGEYWQDVQLKLASKLCSLLPEKLNCTYLVNSGTEAVEAAMKIAKRHTGRTRFVSFRKSYHGSTHGALSVTGNEEKKQAFRPLLPDVHFMDFGSLQYLELVDGKTAAVIVEPIQGDAGVRIPDPSFLHQLQKRCEETGALLIYDEIQVGLGRTGKLFAFEHFKTTPDILVLAKSLGGGLPIGAIVSDSEIMKSLTFNPPLGHITTFGGNPLSCASALAMLEVLSEEVDMPEINVKGNMFKEILNHDKIKYIRQIGLLLGVDLESPKDVDTLISACREQGVIIYRFLSHPAGFRISPPLNISKDLIDEACRIIVENLNRL